MTDFTDSLRDELDKFIQVAQREQWNLLARRYVEDRGINYLRTDFYSGIPTLAEIANAFEYTKGKTLDDSAPIFNHPSVFDAHRIAAATETLIPFAAEFAPPRRDPGNGGYYWENTQFSHCDAMAYYALIRLRKPKVIVEIGSGFSTLVAKQAVDKNGAGTIICIDPEPRTSLPGGVKFIQGIAQQFTVEDYKNMIPDDAFLFIDSTHTVKIGSDCSYLYLKVIPELDRRLLVHSHDIRLPFPLEQEMMTIHRQYWMEQYLLYALLLNSTRFQVIFGSEHQRRLNPTRALTLMHGRHSPGGGSLWYEKLF